MKQENAKAVPLSSRQRTLYAMRGWLSIKPSGWASEEDFVHKHPKKAAAKPKVEQ